MSGSGSSRSAASMVERRPASAATSSSMSCRTPKSSPVDQTVSNSGFIAATYRAITPRACGSYGEQSMPPLPPPNGTYLSPGA